MEIVVVALSAVAMVLSLGNFVCWIMVIIAAFKNEDSPLFGILSILLCGIGAFIIGWIKHQDWGIKQLMLIWTGLFVISLLLNIGSAVLSVGAAAAAGG